MLKNKYVNMYMYYERLKKSQTTIKMPYYFSYETFLLFHVKGNYVSEFSDIDWDQGIFGDLLVTNSRTKYIGQMRVYTKAVILWNIALDEYQGPKVSKQWKVSKNRKRLTYVKGS